MINIDQYLTSTRKESLNEVQRINEMRAAVMKRNNRKGLTTEKQKRQYQASLDIEKILSTMTDGQYRSYLFCEGIRKEPPQQTRMKLA